MPRAKPLPLPSYTKKFYEEYRPGLIMFCRRYKIEDIWDIGIGAVLDLNASPRPKLIKICQELYREDSRWFIGDIKALLEA